jgi:hypothetical protein
MSISKLTTTLAVVASLNIGAGAIGSVASAADMPVKAPPQTPWVFDVHGNVDFNFQNTRVTGGGLLLYPTDSTLFQPSVSVSLDIYKNKSTFINSFSAFGGVWNEDYLNPHALQAGFRHWQEMDWWGGFTVGFAEHWSFTAQHIEFHFPPGGSVYNDAFSIAYDDSYLGFPITINPYFQYWHNERGGFNSLGKGRDTYRLEAGIVPTYSFKKAYGVPLTITAPMYVEFGPTDAWNRNDGTTNFCGPANNAPCSLSNIAYYSLGLKGKYTMDAWIPKRLGTWYLKAGVQYFHIVNEALLASQAATTPGGTLAVPNYLSAKKDVAIVSGGVGFDW